MNPIRLRKMAFLYARVTLGIGFLSGIADRFGLWRGRNVGYGNFDGFIAYTAKVNSFMPASSIPLLAWAATAAELVLGVLLLIGIWPRWTARCQCCSACTLWNCNGYLLWRQVTSGLFGFFCVCRSDPAGTGRTEATT